MGLDFEIELPNVPLGPLSAAAAGFKTGFVFELIDTKKPFPIDAHVMVLSPRVYTLSEPFQSTLTPTEYNTVIEETNGLIIREITLEGTFGVKERSPPFYTNSYQNKQSGTDHFFHLRELFRRYSDEKRNPASAHRIMMVFHSLRDQDHFQVVPRTFETPRNVKTTRNHYDYRITLAVIGRAQDVRLLPADPDGFSFTDALRTVNEAVNDARSFLVEVNATIGDIRRKVANIDAVLLNTASLFQLVASAIGSTSDLVVNYPRRRAQSVADSIARVADSFEQALSDPTKGTDGRALRSLRNLEAATARLLVHPNLFDTSPTSKAKITKAYAGEKSLTQDDIDEQAAGAGLGSSVRAQFGSEANAGLEIATTRSFNRVRVDVTMTIESLARQYGTTPEAIIIANDLRPPYISAAGLPGTLKPGDPILLPNSAAPATSDAVAPNANYQTADEALYGRDFQIDKEVLRLTGKLDLSVDSAHGATDVEEVSGIENVVQGVQIILTQEKGENLYVPDVGRVRAIGSKGTGANVVLHAINMQRAILEDPRVSDIDAITVIQDEDVISMEITPVISGYQDSVSLTLPVGQNSGD